VSCRLHGAVLQADVAVLQAAWCSATSCMVLHDYNDCNVSVHMAMRTSQQLESSLAASGFNEACSLHVLFFLGGFFPMWFSHF
jgi:hypothetical protein